MPSIARKLKFRVAKMKDPLWKGPEVDGITYSMLCNFLICRERFKIRYMQGLRTHDTFSSAVEYGNMWHLCEEIHAAQGDWESGLKSYGMDLIKRYPMNDVAKWVRVCAIQFELYIDYWKRHPDKSSRKSVLEETIFSVPYKLPTGRTVLIRGKVDSVDKVTRGDNKGLWIQENKTKGTVDRVVIMKQLQFDLQSLLYYIAMEEHVGNIRGVRYNVVRRPLSGGLGSIRQKKPTKANPRGEKLEDYYARLKGVIKEHEDTFFHRWNVEIDKGDVDRFKELCLNPLLTSLCDWYDHMTGVKKHPGIHWATPYGFYNTLAHGNMTDVDEYMLSGIPSGLTRVEELFQELK